MFEWRGLICIFLNLFVRQYEEVPRSSRTFQQRLEARVRRISPARWRTSPTRSSSKLQSPSINLHRAMRSTSRERPTVSLPRRSKSFARWTEICRQAALRLDDVMCTNRPTSHSRQHRESPMKIVNTRKKTRFRLS